VVRGRVERKKDTFAFKLLKRDGSKFGRECHTESVELLEQVTAIVTSIAGRSPEECIRAVAAVRQEGRASACSRILDALHDAGALEFATTPY